MKRILTTIGFLIVLAVLLSACKARKKEATDKNDFISILSFLQGQVRHVDTSFYPITQYIVHDSAHVDTFYRKREDFRALAADFLELPDLATPEYKGRYTQTRIFDENLQRVIITYLPVNPDKELIQREELLVEPTADGTPSVIKNVIVNTSAISKDSSVEKRMLWQPDLRFQVTTIKQVADQPESVSTLKVTWNDAKEEDIYQ